MKINGIIDIITSLQSGTKETIIIISNSLTNSIVKATRDFSDPRERWTPTK